MDVFGGLYNVKWTYYVGFSGDPLAHFTPYILLALVTLLELSERETFT